mmetsp:Transcript_28264/g.59437  ORF Transcript_28264/g.59437 Transcript_28264/m.59437 type:complete len:765 (+) Transcript_28264:398-2692(+)
MGNVKSSTKDDLVDATANLSINGNLSERETAATWYRYGVSVTDVYDVVEVLGQGHMGEVFTVRRKVTGMHTKPSRDHGVDSEDDLKKLAEKGGKGGHGEEGKKDKIKRKPSIKGALHKTNKVIRKSIVGSEGAAFANDLESYIHQESIESQHEPPKPGATPLKSIMRVESDSHYSIRSQTSLGLDGGSSHSSGECPPSPASPRASETSERSHRRLLSYQRLESGKKAVAVHFQRTFAVKTILTSRINKEQVEELVNEILIMRKLDHPYVLKLYEVYHVKRKLWLVTELCTGGDLSSRKLNEHDTKNVIEQVLRALVYLHRMGVVHRDIKLENILYENHSKNATIRLIDFGLSKTFDRTESLGDYARTPYTMAPEVAADQKSIVTDKMDVWAVGVITWILLSGEFPFIKTNSDLKDQEKMTKLKKADFYFGITWKGRGITKEAKDFVSGCLQRDPEKRWTAKQALENLQKHWGPKVDKIWDDWKEEMKNLQQPEFVPPMDLPDDEEGRDDEREENEEEDGTGTTLEEDETAAPASTFSSNADRARNIKRHVKKILGRKKTEGEIDSVDESDNVKFLEEVERYTKFGFLKKTILITMANTMDRNDVGRLREFFLRADTNDSGTITLQELKDAFQKISPEADDKKIEELFAGMDRDKSGHIHYAEFLAALAESHGLVTLDRLTEAFDRIDTDGKGYITHEDLKSILGKDYDKENVDKMIAEGDFKKNNKIDYEELLQLMFQDPVKGDEFAGNVTAKIASEGSSPTNS